MHKIIPIVLFSIFYIMLCFGCSSKSTIIKSELDKLFEKNFEGLEIPDVDWIKEGELRNYPYKTLDEVWSAAIIEIIQQGIIVHALKDKGIIVVVREPPFALFIEQKENVNVYLNWMWDLYGRRITNHSAISKAFFDELGLHLYCKDKWNYLFD